jgi:hypothetical protein
VNAVPVVSICALPAGAVLWEAQPGQLSLTVIVKATFTLAPGDATLAPEQDALSEERRWDESPLASVHFPGDFAPSKRRADVTLVGHAYAPHGEPVTSLVASLGVGDLAKAVRVTGDRVWRMGKRKAAEPGPPAPFLRMPLRYERAALGADNPVGIDAHAPPVLGAPALPNLERDEAAAGPPREGQPEPCFGPIAPTWRARRRRLDDADTLWALGMARDPRDTAPPLGPAPQRFDFAFFNVAPADQQVDLLRPGTPIQLVNLHPSHARLSTRLPSIRPQVFRVPPPGTPKARVEEIIVRCDSLWIDTDRGVATATWRGLADVGEGTSAGYLVVAADGQGKKLRWEQVEKRLGGRSAPTLRLGPDGRTPLSDEADPGPPPDPLSLRHDTVKGQRPPAVEIAPAPPPVVSARLSDPDIYDAPTNPLELHDDRTHALKAGAPPVPRGGVPRPAAGKGAAISLPRPPVAPGGARTQGPALRKDLTVRRWAEIAAALAEKGVERAAVLRKHLLTDPAWALVDDHWKKALEAEAEHGEHALADAFEDAYVAAQEKLRRPVGLAEYARLQVGVERQEVGRVLADLDLALGDLVRLQRVWARRVAASPALGEEVARAVEDARGRDLR